MSPGSGLPATVETARRVPSTGLLTDHYELTMLDAALRSGAGARRAAFEVFARRLPPGRRFGVVAGTGRLLEAIAAFRFDDDDLRWLSDGGFLAPATVEWLASYRFTGTITGYREGEPYVPGSPILIVEGTFAEAVVLETVVLSILNHDSAIAAAASRMVLAAGDRPLIEAGSRRTNEWAAPAAARAAYLAGFASSSNLEAGRHWGVPTGGTAAHAFVLVHDDEVAAFRAQVAVTGPATTLLVDTFDVETGIRNAVAVAGPRLGAIRIDSGDLAFEARRARQLLDSLGAAETRIVVSGDLDEHTIAALAPAPVDRFLVGTSLVTGSGAPTAGLVYKLVAVADRPGAETPLRPVAKRSAGKTTRGGVKVAGRQLDRAGRAVAEVVVTAGELVAAGERPSAGPADPLVLTGSGDADIRPLQIVYVRDGELVEQVHPVAQLAAARAHHQRTRAELPEVALDLTPGPAVFVASGAGEPRVAG